MGTPELSICIPTFNRADLLEYCLENLLPLKEKGQDFEVVVADNASEDRTEEVCQTFAERLNIRYYRQSRNVGAYYNVLAVHRLARGEYITYLADDDKFNHDVLMEHLKYLKENPDVLAAYSSWECIDDETGEMLHGYFNVEKPKQYRVQEAIDLIKFMMLGMVHPEIGIFRSKGLHRVMHLDEADHYTCYNLLYQLMHYGAIAFLPGCFYQEVAKPKRRFGKLKRFNHQILKDGGVETVAGELEGLMHRILLDFGHLHIPQEQRYQFFDLYQHFVHVRKMLTHDANMAFKNYIKASRMFHRIELWKEAMPFDKAKQHSETLYPLAGMQAAADIYRSNSQLTRFAVVGFREESVIQEFYATQYPEIPVQPLTIEEAKHVSDPETVMILCARPGDRETIMDQNPALLPGFIINFNDLCRLYQVLPPPGDMLY